MSGLFLRSVGVCEELVGRAPEGERYNLSEVIVIRLAKKLAPAGKEELKLHRFLGTIFAKDISSEQKKQILQDEYGMPQSDSVKRRVTKVCNLSEAIEEEAEKRGEKRGIKIGEKRGIALGERNKLRSMVKRKLEKGKPVEVIAEELEESLETVQEFYNELVGEK